MLKNAPRLLLIVAVQCLIVFGLLECAGRIADPIGISYYPETARFLDRLILEEPIGYRLPPGLHERFHGADVIVNSLGMRDREVAPTKPPGEVRVLLMGDSVPFGIGVAYEDSIPFQLENVLNAAAPPGRTYRVLNMGVPSYNTEQELVQLQTLGMSLEPDAAVLLFSANDIEPKMWVYAKRKSPLSDLAQRSYAACLLFVGYRSAREVLGNASPRINEGGFVKTHPRWIAIEDSMIAIADLLRTRDAPLLVMSGRGGADDASFALLQAAAKRGGFWLDVLDKNRDPRFDPKDPDRFSNSRTDRHCNPLGCSVMANVVAQAMEAMMCAPPSCPPSGFVSARAHAAEP